MKDELLEKRIARHFNAAPLPRQDAVDATVKAALAEATRAGVTRAEAVHAGVPQANAVVHAGATHTEAVHAGVTQAEVTRTKATHAEKSAGSALVSPSWLLLIAAQIRASKGVVWIAQAVIVTLAIIFIANTDTLAAVLAAFGSAAALLSAISVAGVIYNNNASLTEISYSCHFDYRQVTVARMLAYGIGDALVLAILIISGFVMLPSGFSSAALCACVSFFFSGFMCMLLFAYYRGPHALVLSTAAVVAIAAITAYGWYYSAHLATSVSGGFWLIAIVVFALGILLLARSYLARISEGYDVLNSWPR